MTWEDPVVRIRPVLTHRTGWSSHETNVGIAACNSKFVLVARVRGINMTHVAVFRGVVRHFNFENLSDGFAFALALRDQREDFHAHVLHFHNEIYIEPGVGLFVG